MKTYISLSILALVLILSSPSLSAQGVSTDAADSTKTIPAADEFIPIDVEPTFDMEELQSRLIYPEDARKNAIEGKVIVQVYINKVGEVVKTRIAHSDNELLMEAAVNAIKQTAFTPAIQDGEPVGVWMAIPITFKLTK